MLLAVACEETDPQVAQDASNVFADAAGGGVDAGATIGQTGGNTGGGGGSPGGNDGGLPVADAGNPVRSDAGRFDASSPSDAAVSVEAAAPAGDGGPDQFAEVRQICVDTINMYRATLSLPPLARAAANLEACSDQGAKYDGDKNEGHASTKVPGKGSNGGPGRLCGSPSLGAQNTCPGWGVGARTGNATLADALKKCLAQMWAEAEPAEGVKACKDAYFKGDTTCFLAHGHWINMSEPTATAVSCGFYDMGGSKFWMNQDFVGR